MNSALLWFTLFASAAAGVGVWFTGLARWSRRIVTLSGVTLIIISVFWVLPELAGAFGPAAGTALLSAATLAIWFVDKRMYPVCPACSPSHEHHLCSTPLHGFGGPLAAAALFHSVFDGWALLAGAGGVLTYGVILHKLPEAIALGVILRASMPSRARAFRWAIATQATTLAGGTLYLVGSEHVGRPAVTVLLALGGGIFLYLGLHTLHGQWRRATRGPAAAADASPSPSETLSRSTG